MSTKTGKSAAQSKALENFVLTIGKFIILILKISWHGLRRGVLANADRLMLILTTYAGIFMVVYWDWLHLKILNWVWPGIFTMGVLRFFVLYVPQYFQCLMMIGALTILVGLIFGARHYFRIRNQQDLFKHIGLKSATGEVPKIVDIEDQETFKRKIVLFSPGVGLDQYKNKKSDFESTFGAIVENICVSEKSRKLMEIYLSDKELPTMVGFDRCLSALVEPYSFLIGESLGGVMAQSIRTLPHLLIAGTSGNGKSVFFNQALISMMRTSPHIQLYLLDLKLGVEVRAYRHLPNVQIAKDPAEAVALLRAVVKEMNRRFAYIEQKGLKFIDPERDKMDLLLIGVDEASVLYSKRRGDKSGNEMIDVARDLTDEIAKLGRAASIHLIVATQKVTTESIDTKVQENIGGRICFRVNTLQGSNTVLGNKKAYELPDIKGRAIWACGNDFLEVQTPFVSEGVVEREIEKIRNEFLDGKRSCFQALLSSSDLTLKEKAAEELFDEKKV